MDKKFIILADDDALYSALYETELNEENWEVKIVKNGQEALDAMKIRKPDLLLLDLNMPIKSGFDVLQEMRIDPELAPITTIVMTNLSGDVDVAKAIELGAKNYFIKSDISVNQMIDIVKKYFA